MPAGSGPQGVVATPAGEVWVTLSTAGKLARFPASQTSGPAAVLTPSGGSLSNPFGIAAGAGAMYVASAGNATLMGVDATPTYSFTPLPFDAEPWQLAAAPNGELWVTDRANARLFRVSNDPATGGGGSAGGGNGGQSGGKKAPKLSLSASKKQKLGAFVKLKAGCGKEACTVSASGTLSIKKLKLKSAKAHVGAGRSATLKLKLPVKVKTAAAEALAEGKKPLVKIKALAVDGGGDSSAAQVRQVTLTR
jgi:streptogramin lyase